MMDPRKTIADASLAADMGAPPSTAAGKDSLIVEDIDFFSKNQDKLKKEQKTGKAYIGKEADIVLFQKAFQEMERHRMMDRHLPSFHNVVTVSCLETLLKWMLCELVPIHFPFFVQHSRQVS
jgi:hypothetical protein